MPVTGNCGLKRSQISRLLKQKNPGIILIAKDATADVEISLQSLIHFARPIKNHSKWFNSD